MRHQVNHTHVTLRHSCITSHDKFISLLLHPEISWWHQTDSTGNAKEQNVFLPFLSTKIDIHFLGIISASGNTEL